MSSCVPVLLGLLLTCLLVTSSVRARYMLTATFVTYNNSLHSYWNTESGTCCDGNDFPTDCTGPCNTVLQYCFRDYGTEDFINDDGYIIGCLDLSKASGPGVLHTDYIDYSMPPLTSSNRTTLSVLSLVDNDPWPGQMQFFVRSAMGDHVIDYFVLNFSLTVEDTSLSNQRIDGAFFGSDVTFTVSLNLTCPAHFYSADCSIYCRPANSSDMGHYACLSDGSRQCLPGYLNETTNCTSCVPADGCKNGVCSVPGECNCLPGYEGELCDKAESVVPLAAGAAAGSVLLLILLCVLALVAVVALKRRMHAQTVDLKGGSDEKPANGGSYAQESGIGLLGNPVYEAGVSGTHLPLGSPSVEAEYNMDNPLYMMGVAQSSVDDAIPSHDYDYALTQDVAPPTSNAPPPPSASGQVYAEPDIGHPLTPDSPHDYSEPSTGTSHPSASGPIYDAPLVSEQRGTPAISHYETADNVLEMNNPLLSATHDGDREDV